MTQRHNVGSPRCKGFSDVSEVGCIYSYDLSEKEMQNTFFQLFLCLRVLAHTKNMEYPKEKLNFFKICDITANIITEGLRTVFKQEWDKNYQTLLGRWQDSPKNGHDFEKQEPPASKRQNARFLKIMGNGKTEEWDCTALCFGILYSSSIGRKLSRTVRGHVNDLRKFRNEAYAHVSKGAIKDTDCKSLIGRAEAAFLGLNLDVTDIRAIAHQQSFPTEKLRLLVGQLRKEQEESQALREKLSALEEELYSESKTFLGYLPDKPSHVIQERQSEVSMILKHMKELKTNSNGEITTVYISGNPGCGKSQIARMVGEAFYQHISSDELAFVATLNAETLDTLFNSYDSLSRALGCTEFAVGRISTSNDKIEEKLEQFQRLVTPKMKKFSSWLIIIDNVVNLDAVRRFWPTCGSKEYGHGQILVTTQDISTIPENGSHSCCICLSRGMDPDDAVSLLIKASQMTNEENVEEVAKALDYQPLALACAGWYVCSVRHRGCPNFNWQRYLNKLNGGKEEAMGEIKRKCESGYTKSMPAAVRLAVERTVVSEEVLLHTFQFLSICAPVPILLEVAVNFVRKRMPDLDEEEVISKLMESSLVQISFSSEEGKRTLWIHQVVYRAIKTNHEVTIIPQKKLEVISAALGTLQSLTEEDNSTSKIFVEHLCVFLSYVISFGHTCLNFYADVTKVTKLGDFFECFISCALMCLKYGKMEVVKQCLEEVRNFIDGTELNVDKEISSLLFFFCGRALAELSEFKSSIKYFEMSLSFRREIFEAKSKSVADCLLHLGKANYNFSRSVEAKACYNEALLILREICGDKHGDVADCLIGLGNLMGHTEESFPYYQEALSISRKLFGDKHRTVGRCLHNMGVTYTFLCRYEIAEQYLEEALLLLRDIYGEKHEQVAICLTNIGRVHMFCSRYDKAKDILEQALNIRKKIGNQLRVGRSFHFLGQLSEKEGNVSVAVDYYKEALDTFRRYEFPEDHLYVKEAVDALQGLGETSSQGRSASVSRKRKYEDVKTNTLEQPPRKTIKC